MSKVEFTYRPTREPIEQPGRVMRESVAAVLAGAYELSRAKGYQAGIEIRKDGVPIYDEEAINSAVDRINRLVNLEKFSVEQAAERVAKEDGHSA